MSNMDSQYNNSCVFRDFKIPHFRSRQPKLFFVSSSSTTSSVSTSTVCFISTNTGFTTCGKRRRRNILVDGISGAAGQIQPMSARWVDVKTLKLITQALFLALLSMKLTSVLNLTQEQKNQPHQTEMEGSCYTG